MSSDVEDARAACLANWPGAENGGYHPSCCRFPKSCSVPIGPAPLSGGDTRTQLIELLRPAEPWPHAPSPEVIADALLPTVERIADERAAKALEEVAARFAADRIPVPCWTGQDAAQYVRRAASLRAASRGETGR